MPQKRKRPDQEPAEPTFEGVPPPPIQSPTQAQPARKATRQTPVIPPKPPAHFLAPAQNGSAAPVSPSAVGTLQTQTHTASPEQQKSARKQASATRSQPQPTTRISPPVLRWAPPEQPGPTIKPPPAAMASIVTAKAAPPNRLQSDLVAPEITYHVPHAQQRPSALVRPHGPTAQPPRMFDRPSPLTITPVYPPRPPAPPPDRPPLRADRNIDKVVLGNICFRTWYPSYYGKEVLGDSSAHAHKGGSKDAGGKDQSGGKSSSRKDRDHPLVLERLYVCPSCFKYSKELVAWWGHVRVCGRRANIPGRKIYIHPQGRRKVLVPHDVRAPGNKRRRGEGNVRYVEEIVQDEGEWSIWEVDGETDGVSLHEMCTASHKRSTNLLLMADSYSSFARTYPSLPSSSSTTSQSFSMLRASTTSCSSIHPRPSRYRPAPLSVWPPHPPRPKNRRRHHRLRASSPRRKCPGTTITSLVSSSSRRGSARV